MSSQNQKSANRIMHPIAGDKMLVRDLMTDEGEREYIDFGTYDYITKKALDGLPTPVAIIEPYEVFVSGVTNKVINWQTDLIDGIKTYAEALGNTLPKAFHYFKDGDTYTRGGVEPIVVRTGPLIITVTFDWGVVADSVIVF